MTQYAEIRYDVPRPGVARITLARPEIRNAQNSAMLYEIDDALTAAGVDESVRVVVIAADGPDFSAGHNLTDLTGADLQVPESGPVVAQTTRGDKLGIEGQMEYECDAFIPRAVPALARLREADDRRRTGPNDRSRPDARVAVRHHHRG